MLVGLKQRTDVFRMQRFVNEFRGEALIAVLPMVIAFLCLQKYFVQGMVDSAVKE